MKKRTILIIIILTTISLLGIVVVQLFWVKDAWQLKEEQFNNRIRVALKTVVNRMAEEQNLQMEHSGIMLFCPDTIAGNLTPQVLHLDTAKLYAYVDEELASVGIDADYDLAIFSKDRKDVLTNGRGNLHRLLETPHRVSLSCLNARNPYFLSVFFPDEKQIIINKMTLLLILSTLFLLIVVFSFGLAIITLLRQKRLSEMKTDFVNNMTHELKTPISTISVSSEMLMNPAIVHTPDKVEKYAGIIFDENTRLRNQVEQVLQIAIIDRSKFRLKMKKLDVHKLIESNVEGFMITVSERDGRVNTELNASKQTIEGDLVHMTNILRNLLDNAAKYSEGPPVITVATENKNQSVVISVMDKGIGISKEHQKHVFKKFHRVSTGDIHNVKGFGLGLYYVKTMVERHGGEIKLKSEPGKGSRFDIVLPLIRADRG